MSVEVRLLGPLELRVGGAAVYPGPAKRRAVLAVLALDANRPVPLSRLTALLWSGPPPRSAVANIRNHIAALRRTFGTRIVSRPGSYELKLDSQELDVAEFHRLAGSGRTALAHGDPTRAEPELAAALHLWRGPAGHELPRTGGLELVMAGLETDRLRVVENLAEARLDLGHAADLVPMLRDHLTAHPLRERAWAQLMLAWYRAGDLGAALSAYRQAQATLRSQLGVDTGAELTELHVAMLERARWLDHKANAHAEVPRELPPDPAFPTVRPGELAEVLAVAHRMPAAVVVHGPPGSGKSTLVTRAGHRLASAFPDGQIFIRPARLSATDLMARVLRALGVAPGDVPEHADERLGRYRSLLAARRVLVVVDGAAESEQVSPLIPARHGSALLVTSVAPLRMPEGVTQVALPRELAALRGS